MSPQHCPVTWDSLPVQVSQRAFLLLFLKIPFLLLTGSWVTSGAASTPWLTQKPFKGLTHPSFQLHDTADSYEVVSAEPCWEQAGATGMFQSFASEAKLHLSDLMLMSHELFENAVLTLGKEIHLIKGPWC